MSDVNIGYSVYSPEITLGPLRTRLSTRQGNYDGARPSYGVDIAFGGGGGQQGGGVNRRGQTRQDVRYDQDTAGGQIQGALAYTLMASTPDQLRDALGVGGAEVQVPGMGMFGGRGDNTSLAREIERAGPGGWDQRITVRSNYIFADPALTPRQTEGPDGSYRDQWGDFPSRGFQLNVPDGVTTMTVREYVNLYYDQFARAHPNQADEVAALRAQINSTYPDAQLSAPVGNSSGQAGPTRRAATFEAASAFAATPTVAFESITRDTPQNELKAELETLVGAGEVTVGGEALSPSARVATAFSTMTDYINGAGARGSTADDARAEALGAFTELMQDARARENFAALTNTARGANELAPIQTALGEGDAVGLQDALGATGAAALTASLASIQAEANDTGSDEPSTSARRQALEGITFSDPTINSAFQASLNPEGGIFGAIMRFVMHIIEPNDPTHMTPDQIIRYAEGRNADTDTTNDVTIENLDAYRAARPGNSAAVSGSAAGQDGRIASDAEVNDDLLGADVTQSTDATVVAAQTTLAPDAVLGAPAITALSAAIAGIPANSDYATILRAAQTNPGQAIVTLQDIIRDDLEARNVNVASLTGVDLADQNLSAAEAGILGDIYKDAAAVGAVLQSNNIAVVETDARAATLANYTAPRNTGDELTRI